MKMIYEHDGVSVTICFDGNVTETMGYKLFTSKKLLTMSLNSVTEELNRFLDDEKEDKDGRNT